MKLRLKDKFYRRFCFITDQSTGEKSQEDQEENLDSSNGTLEGTMKQRMDTVLSIYQKRYYNTQEKKHC
jgi:hypothetical protein